ncbi:hypothetical protein P153DRAFT_426442 [Dothidotthia symphoricarpi CBS 119687]|uniref:Tyrosine specific protein phosphatases domain-containing protein n=1 Tax=Dothidotthia symphoricarpi CBS 119687 TaxID=1392245 RepID=A0A6A5ZZE6_9PLEO|nr:uncharacterized protein P153DRAFT_426442 [Dothidotthia symphoricarpi CBS 119687]KAF2124395.1 hypothetical protein P153DRAFT_426442 [Dothidotthia symphoricarpi CBS 119687]
MEPYSLSWSSQNGTLRFPQALIQLLRTWLAGPTHDQESQTTTDFTFWQTIRNTASHLISLLNPFVYRGDLITSTVVGMVKLTALCGIGSALWIGAQRSKRKESALPAVDSQHMSDTAVDDAVTNDPGLLKKHSSIKSYTVPISGFTYPKIRTFYRPHPQDAKLPREPRPIPLLVFVHGLGGSIAQFNPILLSLSNVASCLAIDLPGCGLSSFEPKAWDAYTTDALVQLLAVAIEDHRAVHEDQTVILVGHSMGCSLAALLASPSSPHAHLLSQHVSGLIAICPKADPPTKEQVKTLHRVTYLPAFLFDLFRRWDRRGGLNSGSVQRMTGPDAEEETKKLQLRFNQQSRTAVWQRMARGMCPNYLNSPPTGGLPGRQTWSGLDIPVFLAGGEADQVTPASNVKRIVDFLGRDVSAIQPPSEKASLPIAAAPFDPALVDSTMSQRQHQDSGIDANDLPKLDNNADALDTTDDEGFVQIDGDTTDDVTTITQVPTEVDTATTTSTTRSAHQRRLVVKTAIMPKPAAHSLLFAPSTSRIISGLIGSFLADHIDPRLSLAWQLQYLSTEGKWDVKNLEKWKAVQPVSPPIANVFRAMKTLREVDEKHTPTVVAAEWAGKLCAIIDISHDNPVYDPKGLEDGGIAYYKFPTVSKQPPLKDEVQAFIALVDKIRAEGKQGLVGVHCHYGFNRTGFFLVCYLIECLGYRAQDAIDAFQQARAPGVRHSHFIDELHVRYCRGLRKAPTL